MSAGTLDQGITLMLVGMGTVFTFLTLLVVAMSLSARLIARFSDTVPENSEDDDAVAAAISVAIHHHQQQKETQ